MVVKITFSLSNKNILHMKMYQGTVIRLTEEMPWLFIWKDGLLAEIQAKISASLASFL